MELRNRETGELVTDSQLRSLHPNTSFPEVITPEIIDNFGYDPVLEGPQPTLTPPYEIAVRDGVEQVNGQWFTKYVAGPIFADTEDETAAEQEAAYRFQLDSQQANAVRQQRNRLLAESDFTQLADAPVDSLGWSTYRQALRDIPNQEGFPWSITWPEQPN